MIEGLHFDIPYAELFKHLKEKAAYHDERVVWYLKQIEGLKKGGVESDMDAYSGGSPVSNMQRKENEHLQKAEYFFLLAAYLVKDETYRLSRKDMIDIELIQRHY